MRTFVATVVIGSMLAGTAPAGVDYSVAPYLCARDRMLAAGKYANCVQKALSKFFGPVSVDFSEVVPRVDACIAKYASKWSKFQLKYAGTNVPCEKPRFDETTQLGTVIDNLTGLQWEKKTDDGTFHDVDNQYGYSTFVDANVEDADGTVFTSFLANSNFYCLAGHCDWRLPTLVELLTIAIRVGAACTDGGGAQVPCIDPIFQPTSLSPYLTSTAYHSSPSSVWLVQFTEPNLGSQAKQATVHAARAVRSAFSVF